MGDKNVVLKVGAEKQKHAVCSCSVRGILQESPDDGDIREEISVAVAVGGGAAGPGVLVQEVPDNGNVVQTESASTAAAAAARAGVVRAAQEVSDDGDAVEAEGAAATVTR